MKINKLKFWRWERQLSQYELSQVSGVPRSFIQLIEQGIKQPSHEQVELLAIALGLDKSDLLNVGTQGEQQ